MRFFSPPENPSLMYRERKLSSIFSSCISALSRFEELARRHLLALRSQRGAQEVDGAHTGDRGRVLEAEEEAEPRAGVGREREQVLAAEGDRAAGDDVLGVTHERVRERALARAVRPHERVDLALLPPRGRRL